ncbi:mitochondrial ribosomal protein L4 [Lycorma delicatula]|uniref:mitochondrial ribosomal protein L4 n=1 Tax=Lycorma delicatula TaxID=130591 RepID=UPI003F51302D
MFRMRFVKLNSLLSRCEFVLCRYPGIRCRSTAVGDSVITDYTKDVSKSSDHVLPEKAVPLITHRNLNFLPKFERSRQAWVENFDTLQEKKLGIIDLHPKIFGEMPHTDVIYENVRWQTKYKKVDFAHCKVRSEVHGGGRKPWPQKGLGRARHGSIRSPLFKGGGCVHGPRSPTVHFYMLPFYTRILGLTSMLSVKLAQDDLHIVDSLEIPTDDPSYLEELISERCWGVSALLIDDTDVMPRNITAATSSINHINLMPVYGLNVHSMLKHETLILTLAAVEKIEEKILFHLNRTDSRKKMQKFELSQV